MNTIPFTPNAVPERPLLKPITSLTQREQVTQSVRNALMNGHFQPGQIMTVKAVSGLLGSSVMPTREALNRLIAEGALELRANRSVVVPVLSRQEFDELTHLRCHVESLAATQAAAKVGAAHIARLVDIDQAMRAAVLAKDIDAYLNGNFQFHFLIYRLGASSFVLSIIEKLWVRVGPLIRFCLNESGIAEANNVHAEVIRSLRCNDSAALSRAIHEDISTAAKTIAATFDTSAN
jgi:DNA-binding GntR family transcriptional regulator